MTSWTFHRPTIEQLGSSRRCRRLKSWWRAMSQRLPVLGPWLLLLLLLLLMMMMMMISRWSKSSVMLKNDVAYELVLVIYLKAYIIMYLMPLVNDGGFNFHHEKWKTMPTQIWRVMPTFMEHEYLGLCLLISSFLTPINYSNHPHLAELASIGASSFYAG